MKNLILFWLFFIVLLFYSQRAHAQQALRLIENEYQKSNSVTERLNLAPKYANALFFDQQKEASYRVLKHNITQAVQQEDGKYAAVLYAVQAMNFRLDNNQKEASKSLDLAQKYALKTKNDEAKGYVAYAQGWVEARNNQTTEAVASYLKAISYYENAPTTSTLYVRFGHVAKELSTIYGNLNEFELEEKYSKQFLVLASKQNDINLIFDAYMRMGYVYEQKYEQNPDQVVFRDRAEQYYLMAITTYNQGKSGMLNKSDLSYAAINLANLYISFDHEKAMQYAQLGNRVSLETGNPIHIASSYGILAELALQTNEYNLAKAYFLKASSEISKSNIREPNIELSILESLSRISELQNNYAEALNYNKKYVEAYTALYDQEKLDISKKLESQFENERQQQKYIKLQLESDKRAQEIKLINILRTQREQVYNNLKLVEENQRERLKFTELESEKKEQQLRLAKLETEKKNTAINNYIKTIRFNEKLNTYFTVFIIIFIILIAVLLYAYKQRLKAMKQRDELHVLAIEKEKQHSKISTLTALLEGQEQERARLARDLHDGLGGLLSSTKLQLSHLTPQATSPVNEGISQSITQIDGAVEELRLVAHNLMPELLMKYGLVATITEFASRMTTAQLEVHAQFLVTEIHLPKEKQLLIYRIVQELVNNAIKHAQASEIIIQLSEQDHDLLVTVEDNGKGFDLNKINVKKTAGFHNIESRIEFLKGTMTIFSEEKVGTSIEFKIPMQAL